MAGKAVKLQTHDGNVFEVESDVVARFEVLKTMLEDLHGDDDETPIQLPDVIQSKSLEQIIKYCRHHVNDSIAEQQSSAEDCDSEPTSDEEELAEKRLREEEAQYEIQLDPWDDQFLRNLDPEDEDAIFPLIQAANYLNVSKLLDVCCKYIAGMIRGRTPQWIRKRFKLKCDFTGEQKAQIREELSWYDENVKMSDDES